jgi:hypothetical protein
LFDDRGSLLDTILEFSRPLFNRTAIENHELLHSQTADHIYSWHKDHEGCLQLSVAGVAPQNLAAQVPPAWRPVALRSYVLALLLGSVVAFIIRRVSVVIAEQLFLLDLALPATDPSRQTVGDEQEIWENCTSEEKLALYDLASDGFVNHNNPAIPALVERRLILYPSLKLRDAKLENLVKREGARKSTFRSLAEDAPSTWQTLKWPLGIVMIAAAAFLFFSQRHAFDTSLGFIGALVTGLTAIYKLLDVLRGPGRPS